MIERQRRARRSQIAFFLLIGIALVIATCTALVYLHVLTGTYARWVATYWYVCFTAAVVVMVAIRAGHDQFNQFLNRRRNQAFIDNGTSFLIRPSAEEKITPADMVKFWNQASSLIPYKAYMMMGLSGDTNGITYHCCTHTARSAELVINNLHADFPSIQIERITRDSDDDPLQTPDSWHVAEIVLKPTDWQQPIDVQKGINPLLAVVDEIGRLPAGVRAGVQVYVRSGSQARSFLQRALRRERKKETPDKSQLQAWEKRLNRPFLEVHMIAWAAADNADRASMTAYDVSGDVVAQYEDTNRLQRTTTKRTPIRPNKITGKLPKLTLKSALSRQYSLLDGQPMTDNDLALCFHLIGDRAAQLSDAFQTTINDVTDDNGIMRRDDLDHILGGLQHG